MDGSAAICARIEIGSIKKTGEAGWLHILKDVPYVPYVPQVQLHVKSVKSNWTDLQNRCQLKLSDSYCQDIANVLGVSINSLKRIGLGFDDKAFTFPMRDFSGSIIGIRKRFLNGFKSSVKGSRAGLFIPEGLNNKEPLLICEGPTDTAAALDLGFNAIGRPSCNSAAKPICDFCKNRNVVIIADNDTKPNGTNPGVKGARELAKRLLLHCKTVRLTVVPEKHGDLRCWLQSGLTHNKLRAIIKRTKPLQLKIGFTK